MAAFTKTDDKQGLSQSLTSILDWLSRALDAARRAPAAWAALDEHMPKVNRAFKQVRNELYELGLLADGICLDKIDLKISPIPSRGEAGYVYEGDGLLTSYFLEPGDIHLPSDLPHNAYVPGGTLIDVIRHEFAHSWHWLDPDLFDRPWFKAAFGSDYKDMNTKPLELWERRLQRDRAFQQSLLACRDVGERDKTLSRRFHQDFVSEYAATLAREDFAETFMFYLRNRKQLDRFKSRTGLYKKLKAVEAAVKRTRKQNGL